MYLVSAQLLARWVLEYIVWQRLYITYRINSATSEQIQKSRNPASVITHFRFVYQTKHHTYHLATKER